MHSDDGQAVAVIQRMAKNIRTIFRNSRERKSHHPLAEELLLVENYFHIQQTRFGADFQYTMPTEEQLTGVDLTLNVPLMILQINCENAVEHGIRNQEGVGYVRVDLHNEADFVRIVIEDNGVGRKKAADIGSLGSGQGTKMMAELFRAFNLNNHLKLHQYFEDDIFTKPDGTRYGTRSIILIPKSFNYELTDFLRASG
jgi:sensor histidine kinase YesM